MNKKNAKEILDKLYEMYPDAECELNYTTPFELLIATVLSAQTTDKKVNQVTESLFKVCNTPEGFLKLTQGELEGYIKQIGLYKNKSKNILSLCKSLVDDFNGEVPRNHEELMKLAGVGRKTANVVLSNAFGVPALAVDTHVFRVSNRIGLAKSKDVEGTEQQLMKLIPKDQWIKAHHTLIFHGRYLCKAMKPGCDNCPIAPLCKFNIG
ncbi:endonuclease III [Clostridium sp. 19966]|uniref:endonuclease III n=1 Tax=Clostridium sp. 19966 TaxID=2768166 RepID=UPI0028DFE9DF|nr:endonuclease III [Clostridium sp. 19966]MDT8718510.1 endonuclease III [Clostridium sp. 19966]